MPIPPPPTPLPPPPSPPPIRDWLAIADFVTYQPSAVLLLGSYITRSSRPGINASVGRPSFRFPTLSIAGELDGLTRVSRLAEAYWWQQARQAAFPALQAAFPVLIIPGMNHGQWAVFDGPPPNEVATYDLAAEITPSAALAAGAAALANFVSAAVGGSAAGAAAVAAAQAASAAFLAPLLAAQVFESSYNLLPPCYDAPPSPSCQVGSPFSEWAQQIIFNTAESSAAGGGAAAFPYHARVADAMHPVADLHPIHLGNITNACAAPTAACTLLASTVTENAYDPLFSQLDVALYPTSPHEVKVKLTSRQNGMLHAGVPPAQAPFNVTDAPPLCAVVNNATFEAALAAAAPATAARYLKRGLPLRFGPDNIGFAGPQFTDGTLQFGLVNESAPFVWVNSTSLPTPIPYFVKLAEGFHYCLLLSPSRAMEWIYVDGLRPLLVQ